MKRLKISFVLFMLCFNSYSQNFPKGYELLTATSNTEVGGALIYNYAKTSSEIFNDVKQPYILFFSFLECTGCEQFKNLILKPNYGILKEKFGLEIYCIVRLVDNNKNAIVKEYCNSSYPVYFDNNDLFFNATSDFVDDEKYKIARPRILLISSGKVTHIPLDNVFPISNFINYLNENI